MSFVMSSFEDSSSSPKTPCKRLSEDGAGFSSQPHGKRMSKNNESLEHDSATLTEVHVEAESYLTNSGNPYSKKDGKNVWASFLGETEKDSDLKDVAVKYDTNIKIEVEGGNNNNNNEPRIHMNENPNNNLVNLVIAHREEPLGAIVAEALELFEEYFKEFSKELENLDPSGERKATRFAHFEAAKRLKKEGKYIFPEQPFGQIPGVEIGDEFRFRSQLVVIGLHRQLVAGIDHVALGGKIFATSVVDGGRYENRATALDVLIYSGHGNSVDDQKLEKGNLALVNSMKMGYPVRVTYKRRGIGYVYDGIYVVKKAWKESNRAGKLVYKFELHRMPNQPRPIKEYYDVESKEEVCVVEDISVGKEKIRIRAMNGVDGDQPPTFAYVINMVYPSWYQKIEPDGCECVDGCADTLRCTCVVKNRGEIPYNENGSIMKATAKVHECGLLCKCPSTCMNRVSQLGVRYRLEIFKTENRGWGVRSRDIIPSGGFVCEYIGEFLREKEADLRVGGDEYLFDIWKGSGESGNGYSIDAAVYGNIGRFFNHSCSPNMYAQKVIYDHDDHRMPRIMFFATEEIPPLKELSYDYNYKLGTVCDADGNTKTKDCCCGSLKCRKRLY